MNKPVNVILLSVIALLLAVQTLLSFTGTSKISTDGFSTNQAGVSTTAPSAPDAMFTSNPEGAPAEESKPKGPLTDITFKQSEYDFGKIKDGDKVSHTFTFTNTGKNPLIISNARGSCGCTVPEWPKEPIAPGGTGSIKVEFDSKGKVGVKQNTVTITANTEPENTYLKISADVQPVEGS